jgi:hypothetical protein
VQIKKAINFITDLLSNLSLDLLQVEHNEHIVKNKIISHISDIFLTQVGFSSDFDAANNNSNNNSH